MAKKSKMYSRKAADGGASFNVVKTDDLSIFKNSNPANESPLVGKPFSYYSSYAVLPPGKPTPDVNDIVDALEVFGGDLVNAFDALFTSDRQRKAVKNLTQYFFDRQVRVVTDLFQPPTHISPARRLNINEGEN